MVKMNSKVLIGNLVFTNQVNAITIDQSWKNLTQTATVKLPRFKKLVNDGGYKINTGDKVVIQLGYDNILLTEFEGYISGRLFNSPLEFECQDEMWKLKQQTVTQAWGTITLKKLIDYLHPGIDTKNIQDVTLTNFRLDRVSKAKALEKLKEEYGLVAYFRGKDLKVGLAYTVENNLGEVVYHFQKNVPKNEHKLEFKEKEDIRIKVKAISILPNNKKVEASVIMSAGTMSVVPEKEDAKHSDENYNVMTLHFYNLTRAQLIKQAMEKMKLLAYTGYRGMIKSFGRPWATHGMTARIIDNKYPEREGNYFIDGVKTAYNKQGCRREIELGLRVDQ